MSNGYLQRLVESAGGQRFFMAMGAGIVNTSLVWFGHIPPDIYRDLTIATVGVFIGAATYQTVADMRSARAAGQTYEEKPGV